MNCERCGKEHNGSFGSGRFCSRACANGKTWTEADKLKKSIAAKNSKKVKEANLKQRKPRRKKTCPICNTKFEILSRDKIYCSKTCYLNDKGAKYRKTTPGGYRPGSGRSKSGYYRGVYCGSTYELAWLTHRIDHNLPFERFEGIIERDSLKYIPDFLINEGKTIIEIKGYEDKEKVNAKTKLAESFGYEVLVLRKDDLKEQFDWVKNNYQYKNMQELYDEYKPKFVYTCTNCGIDVSREKEKKTDEVFCSRQCAGKYRKSKNDKAH